MGDYDDYNYDGGMVPDSGFRKRKSAKTNLPRFRPITKRRGRKRRGRYSDSSDAIAGFFFGMIFIFPALAVLTIVVPKVILTIFGIIMLAAWLISQRFKTALIALLICFIPILLGFVSIGIFLLILN